MLKALFATMTVALTTMAGLGAAQAQQPYKIGLVLYMSGPGAESQGVPAWKAAQILTEALNKAELPKPYDQAGFGGVPVEISVIDESGSTTQQVQELRNGYERSGFDAIIGYTSSSNCLAVSPVAEQMKKLLILFTCGTPRIFEESKYNYVFRLSSHETMDNVALARYVKDKKIDISTIAAINPDYVYGRDNWTHFTAAMTKFTSNMEVKAELWPKLGAGQYGTEISSLLRANTKSYYSVFWGGDLEAFLLQAGPRGLLNDGRHLIVPDAQHIMPSMGNRMLENVITGARGLNAPFAPPGPLNDWLVQTIEKKAPGTPLRQAQYRIVQTILGLKTGVEKAMAVNGGKRPTTEQIAAAMTGMEWESPSGTIKMVLGDGHQAIQGTAVGTTKRDPKTNTVRIVDIERFAPECVNPPVGIKADDWIAKGFPGAKCN